MLNFTANVQPVLAVKTVAAIDAAIEADGGNRWRGLLRASMAQTHDAYNTNEDDRRSHLGASIVGNECERATWYNFRWAFVNKFSGQMLRLFNRGHLEEGRFIAMLQLIGCTVYQYDANGKQFRMLKFGGHFSGSGDGVAMGCPDVPPGKPVLLEFKSSNAKNFDKMIKGGVRIAKPTHYAQFNQYGPALGIDTVLYMVINKDTEELYAEIVPIDIANNNEMTTRAGRIIGSPTPPPRLRMASPAWHECKYCDAAKVCFGIDEPQRNCRTCVNSFPANDGAWYCRAGVHNGPMTKEQQKAGCAGWRRNC